MMPISAVFDLTTTQRLDVYVSEVAKITRSRAVALIEDGNILVNGKNASKNTKLKKGDLIEIQIPDLVEPEAIPEDIPIDIVYEDDDLLVVNKPKGMVVHPAAGHYTGTLVNAILFHCGSSLSGINGVLRPGILHRIDMNTSGLLIIAKNDASHQFLAEQIKEHSFTREYEAIVYGNIKNEEGRIEAPIGRHPVMRKKMAVTDKNSKEAITEYTVIARYNGFTHLRLKLFTGRTHQIRVHMSYMGHPVAGDEVYGPKKVITSLNGQCLHAKKLGFIHPKTKEYMEFESDLPKYFTDFIKKINN